MSRLESLLEELGALVPAAPTDQIIPLKRERGELLLKRGHALRLDDKLGCSFPGVDVQTIPLGQADGYVGYALPPSAQELNRYFLAGHSSRLLDKGFMQTEILLRVGAVVALDLPGWPSGSGPAMVLKRLDVQTGQMVLRQLYGDHMGSIDRGQLVHGVNARVVGFASDEERAVRDCMSLKGFR